MTHPSEVDAAVDSAAIARAALLQLVKTQQDPTPSNYQNAYFAELQRLGLQQPAPPKPAENNKLQWVNRLISLLMQSLRQSLRQCNHKAHPEVLILLNRLNDHLDAWDLRHLDGSVVEDIQDIAMQSVQSFEQQHQLLRDIECLCMSLMQLTVELSEHDPWVRSQCERMQNLMHMGHGLASTRDMVEALNGARERQNAVYRSRQAAREEFRELLGGIGGHLHQLGDQTESYGADLLEYTQQLHASSSINDLKAMTEHIGHKTQQVQQHVQSINQHVRQGHERIQHLELQIEKLEAELRKLSSEVQQDALTGLANRRGLDLAFENECSKMGQGHYSMLSIAVLDIDHFKKFNDTWGHVVGDEALKTLAQTLKNALRPHDFICRFGGEEFVLLMPSTRTQEAQKALQRVLSQLQRTPLLSTLQNELILDEVREYTITFSAGIAQYRHGDTLQTSIEFADQALYEAKRLGRSRIQTV